jgi:hypothetical protein
LKIFTSCNDPEAMRDESGEHATDLTASTCPEKVFTHLLSSTSHTLAVLSSDPDMTLFPVLDQQTLQTTSE